MRIKSYPDPFFRLDMFFNIKKRQDKGGIMPTQIFEITRAPEAEPITARGLKYILFCNRRNTEWEVREIKKENVRSEKEE